MRSLPIVSRPQPPQVLSKRTSRLSAALMLCALSSLCLAQEKGALNVPAPVQQGLQATQAKAAANLIVGTWGSSRSDKETGEQETSIIEFNRDGSYTTRLRNSQFPEWEKMPLAGGRYAVVAAEKGDFTLVLDRTSGDIEEDKSTARTTMAVSIVDEKTLRAPDGALLNRLK